MILAVDFDGTCVDHRYPRVGPDVPHAVASLRSLVDDGYRIVLWTMRSDGRSDGMNPLTDAVAWFERHGVPLFGVNGNPEQRTWTASPKAYANAYVDDAAVGCPLIEVPGFRRPCVDWLRVLDALIEASKPGDGKGAGR